MKRILAAILLSLALVATVVTTSQAAVGDITWSANRSFTSSASLSGATTPLDFFVRVAGTDSDFRRVEFSIDGALFKTDANAPFQAHVTTTAGQHALQAVARRGKLTPLSFSASFTAGSVVPPTTTTPAPTSTSTPPPAGFPTRAQALARANVVVSSGSSSAQYRVGSPPADTTYDLRDHTTTAFPNTHAFPYSFGRDSAATRIVVIGGHAIGTQPRNWSWDQVHAVGGAGTTMLGSDFQVSYDFYTENQHDGIQMLPPSGGGSEYLIDGLTCVWIRDDCIEVDTEFSGTIRNVVADGVNTAISLGQSSKNPNAVTNIENAVFVHAPMVNARAADGIGHQTLFKQKPGGTVNMTNVTDCMYENPITPSRIQIRPPGTWTNVTFVLGPGWVGPDPTVPQGASVSRDWAGLCMV